MAKKKKAEKPKTIAGLNAAKYNPRKIDDRAAEGLSESLKEFGDISGIVFNLRTRNLVAGHQRVEQLRAKHGDEVEIKDDQLHIGTQVFPIRYVDWPLKKEQAANVAANNPKIQGEFTDDLGPLLLAMRTQDEDLFDRLRGADLASELKIDFGSGGPGLSDADDIPKPPTDPITKLGDLWLLGKHRVLCGDSTNAENVERILDGFEPFIMVTDPPYGIDYQGGEANAVKRERQSGDDSTDTYDPAYSLCPCNVSYVWFAGCNALPVYSACLRHGFTPRALLIWNKLKAHYGAPSAHYKQRHEPCLYSVRKGSAKFVGDMTTPTVWDIEQPHINEYHPTQKPVECMARPIRNHGGKEDDVYDPFLGSGTTLIACEQLDRTCFGIEISPVYCDVIIERWEKFTGQKAQLESKKKGPANGPRKKTKKGQAAAN